MCEAGKASVLPCSKELNTSTQLFKKLATTLGGQGSTKLSNLLIKSHDLHEYPREYNH